jgi:hypothetical protein
MTKTATPAPHDLAATLRQMLAALEAERQALAALDIDALTLSGRDKLSLCDELGGADVGALDGECRGLLLAARQANEVNRRVRNLVAANISARLDALTGALGLYRSPLGGSRFSAAHA